MIPAAWMRRVACARRRFDELAATAVNLDAGRSQRLRLAAALALPH